MNDPLGSTPARQKPLYRGEKISKVEVPLFIKSLREMHINMSDPVDQGVYEFFSEGAKPNNIGVLENTIYGDYVRLSSILNSPNERLIQMTQISESRLDPLLNAEKEEKLIKALNLSKYLPSRGVGMLVLGRASGQLSKEDFQNNFGEAYTTFMNMMNKSDYHRAIFIETLKRHGIDHNKLRELVATPDGKKAFMKAHQDYLYNPKTEPTPKLEDLASQGSELFNNAFFREHGSGSYKPEEKKAQGIVYVAGKVICFADTSTYGATASVGRSKEELPAFIQELKRQKELDKTDSSIRRELSKERNVEDLVTINQKGLISISMLREDESDIVHVPLIDTALNKKQLGIISFGSVNPFTNRQACSLMIYNEVKKKEVEK